MSPNIKEMVPEEGQFQFKASELRKLPKVSDGFLTKRLEPDTKQGAAQRDKIVRLFVIRRIQINDSALRGVGAHATQNQD